MPIRFSLRRPDQTFQSQQTGVGDFGPVEVQVFQCFEAGKRVQAVIGDRGVAYPQAPKLVIPADVAQARIVRRVSVRSSARSS